MHSKVIGLVVVLSAFFLLACDEKKEEVARPYPSLDTKAVTEINENGATFNAEIIAIGTGSISDHGFVYSESPNPQLNISNHISLGGIDTKGAYSSPASRALTKGKKYYVRAYAYTRNKEVLVYGQEVQFESLGGGPPELTDFYPKQSAIGDTITVVGIGFSDVPANNNLALGALTTKAVKARPDTLWFVVPAVTLAGENDVALIIGPFTIKHQAKFLLKPLLLSTITPTAVSFGDTITVTGPNFPASKTLTETNVLGTRQPLVSATHTEIKFVVPNDVKLAEALLTVTSGTQTVTSTETITLLKPVLNDFTPLKGTGALEVVIHGNNFNPIAGNNNVTINGKALVVSQASRNMLTVKIPAGLPLGKYAFTVTVTGQRVVSADQFEIY